MGVEILQLLNMGERSGGHEGYSLSNYSKATRLLTIFALGVASCRPRELQDIPVPEAEPVPATETLVPSPSSTESSTPTDTTTPTETFTPTPEVKDYGVCETEDFLECPIPAEDLFNGEYLAFLETLSSPFDPNNMKQVPWVSYEAGDDFIYPDPTNAPNFEGMTTIGAGSGADFRRGVTAGHTVFEGKDYLILPVEFYDPSHTEKNTWVIAVYPLFGPSGNYLDKEHAMENIMNWWQSMKVSPLFKFPFNPGGRLEAPLTERTFDENQDMAQRFEDFLAGERSVLHGKVLLTTLIHATGDSNFR